MRVWYWETPTLFAKPVLLFHDELGHLLPHAPLILPPRLFLRLPLQPAHHHHHHHHHHQQSSFQHRRPPPFCVVEPHLSASIFASISFSFFSLTAFCSSVSALAFPLAGALAPAFAPAFNGALTPLPTKGKKSQPDCNVIQETIGIKQGLGEMDRQVGR
jgi:hypothetical protein